MMSTPIWMPSVSTDLGDAFSRHLALFRGQRAYALGGIELDWLNALRDRALRRREQPLVDSTDKMLVLLAHPSANPSFKTEFETTFAAAWRSAYPLSALFQDERRFLSGTTMDYTLNCIDPGQVRAIEDAALADPSMQTFVQDMITKLTATSAQPRYGVYRGVFDIYSEALVCLFLRVRTGGRLTITKIPETKLAGPDFECSLDVEINGKTETLAFFIEVKSLDIVHAPQRLPEMLDEGMEVQIDVDRQIADGQRVAVGVGEIAPHRPYGNDPDYDPRSVRGTIETLIEKAAGNFKNTQFKRGPTFALANILRLPRPESGTGTLAPFYYDRAMGGACVSGVLWNMAFGEVGAPIHRTPDFEGKGTADRTLKRAGILVDPSLGLETPGLIVLHYDQRAYRFDGFYDPHWTSKEWVWSDVQVEAVLYALCGEYNDRSNGHAHEYAMNRDRT
ncbi:MULTISPECIES: hypothetical protein [unclassified Bradyrhizobium]|uniref:hypothetical protein n=1 Tax=unclassified Bradyrhizobium TaxID=2631580 RepID=UPI001FFA5FDD|nr:MULTISPECIES: hypothetical protein [unclassified Bradyrhizobium]MCK1301212.1 hypothetical protein [Bradyrhizobium sp. 37]MCK1774206.1 hypothetical protein [Bradyrhizobium sp. 134]